MAAIRLIQNQGVDVVFPRHQSRGQPAYNSGFPQEARKVARKQMTVFPKNYPVVVPSGPCAGMVPGHHPGTRLPEPRKPDGRMRFPNGYTN